MRGVYWTPQAVTRVQRGVIAALAVLCLLAVERLPSEERQPHYALKIRAAQIADQAMGVVRQTAAEKRITMEGKLDPTRSGMIGRVISPITSGSGSLISKQTTINPNFAAVMVEWLKELDVKKGDLVAVGVSGSFPAANLATYSAIHAIEAKPLIITSVGSSQFGANNPSLTWLDMETALRERGVFPFRSLAASRGGVGDDGIGLSPKGKKMLDRAITRNEIPKIEVFENEDTATQREQLYLEAVGEESTQGVQSTPAATAQEEDGVARRMRLYRSNAANREIKAYVNVGGGTLSVGTRVGKRKFHPGINKRYPRSMQDIPSVIGEFLQSDIPAIHVSKIVSIAQEYGLPIAPITPPEVGQGDVFQRREPNRWLAGFSVLALLLALLAIARPPWGTRLLNRRLSGLDSD